MVEGKRMKCVQVRDGGIDDLRKDSGAKGEM